MQLNAEITMETSHRQAESTNDHTVDAGRMELNFHRDDYDTTEELFSDMTKLIDMFVGRSLEM